MPVPERHRATLSAAVHVDHTTRPQTVSRDVNPLYHDLLTGVAGHTGHPVVLNTSFNGKEEPVVNSPADALPTFLACPMETSAIGPFLVHKTS